MITVVAISVALAVWAALTFTTFARSDRWRATVTPLASIIGSGFLISGPLLAAEFGSLAILAMAALLALAYAIGWVVRFNIAQTEVYLEGVRAAGRRGDPVQWMARGSSFLGGKRNGRFRAPLPRKRTFVHRASGGFFAP